LPGWQTSTVGINSWDGLPEAAQAYIRFLEKQVGKPVAILSTGPDRNETLILDNPFV
jgi:adenylosuccinate synthase